MFTHPIYHHVAIDEFYGNKMEEINKAIELQSFSTPKFQLLERLKQEVC